MARAPSRASALLAALGLLACVSPFAGALEPPEVSLVGITPVGGSAFEQRVRVDLRLLNPNNTELVLEGFQFALTLNGEPFARGASGESAVLPRLGDAVLTVEASTTLLDWLRQLQTLAGGDLQALDYSLEGQLYLERPAHRSLEFSREGSFTPPPGTR